MTGGVGLILTYTLTPETTAMQANMPVGWSGWETKKPLEGPAL